MQRFAQSFQQFWESPIRTFKQAYLKKVEEEKKGGSIDYSSSIPAEVDR